MTAHNASAACSLGQGLEANARIDELKKTIGLVSELIAATQIADPPSISRKSSPRRFSNVSALSIPGSTAALASPTRHTAHATAQDTGQTPMHFSSADLASVDPQSILDTSDLSRKRCASSMGGDRVIKAMKMEPQEDTLHIMPQPSAFPPNTVPSMVPFVTSNVPQEPISRPASSSGLPHNAFNVLSLQSTPPAVPGIGFSMPMSSAPLNSADFISSSPMSTTVVHSTQFPAQVQTSWPDGTTAITQRTHQHSLSASSLTNGISFQSIPSTSAGLPPLQFSSAGTFVNAPTQSHVGAGISPPIGRVSRSGSLTSNNQIAFGLPEVPPLTGALDFLQPSFAPLATKQAPHSPTSSQEGDNDFDSDCGDCSQSPESSSGNIPRFSTQVPRPIAGHSARSSAALTRKSVENLTSNHANDVPQEYRAEVDRIFFEFLNSICSNRKHVGYRRSSQLGSPRLQWMPQMSKGNRFTKL